MSSDVSSPPAPAAPAVRPLWPRYLLAGALTLAFAFPWLALLWYRADPLTIANESIAYRFLFSERLLHGERATVWVLAGFLTTAIQTTGLAVINGIWSPSLASLPLRMHLFAYGYTGFVTAVGGAIFFRAAANRRLTVAGLLLLALPALGPAYATRGGGFYYYTLPDYYHLDVLLTLAAVWIFLLLWTREPDAALSGRRLFLLGVFVGVMCANKVTMATLGLPLLAVPLLAAPLTRAKLVRRGAWAAGGVVIGFLFVISWFYLFDFAAVGAMFSTWLATIRNPGGESNFWSTNFRGHLTGYAYGYVGLFFLLTLAVAAATALARSTRRRTALVTSGTLLLGGLAWCWFIIKRPAGTTFFEAAVAWFGLGAMALAMGAHRRWARTAIAVAVLGWTGFAATTFQGRRCLAILRESRPWAQAMWRLHRDLLMFAAGRPIIIVHPRNEYGYGGVAEFLLKGTADVPSWNVTDNGRPILERYSPHTSFRNEYGGPAPDDPYPAGAVVFWVDRPEFRPLVRQYDALADLLHDPAATIRRWTIWIQGGRTVLHAEAVLTSAGGGTTAPDQPPIHFGARRTDPTTVVLTWLGDGISSVEIEFRRDAGDYEPLGLANAGMVEYRVGDLAAGATYQFRARKIRPGWSSAWVEITVPPAGGASP